MSYIYDQDLEFLAECTDDDLTDLFYCLAYDKDGEKRISENLTNSKEYLRYGQAYSKYWRKIAGELQLFGGNTFMNLFRGNEGVKYKEILIDVAKSLKVSINSYDTVVEIENRLLIKLSNDLLKNLSIEEQKQFLEEIAEEIGIDYNILKGQEITMAAQFIFKMGGFKSYKITLKLVNYLSKALFGRGLSLVGNATLTKTLSKFAGPIGWAITIAWTAIDIADPAKRVTIPAVLHIIHLRKKVMNYKNF